MFRERRRYHRTTISEVVLFRKFQVGSAAEFREGRALNVSLSGIYFLTDEPLEQGERLELTFRPLHSPSDMRSIVQVVRVEKTLDGYGVGAQFVAAPVKAYEYAAGQGAVW